MKPARGRFPIPVGETVSRLLDPVLRKKAGMTMGLIAAWPEIVGERLEGVTRAEKLVWPAVPGAAMPPATLVVACEGASALRLQHQADEIVERVNVFLGYRAVRRLRIEQKAVAAPVQNRKPKLAPLGPADAEALDAMTARIEDPGLKAALRAYGESILSRNRMTKP